MSHLSHAATQEHPYLCVSNLQKHYGEADARIEVLRGIDLCVHKGELCVLLGPSGSLTIRLLCSTI